MKESKFIKSLREKSFILSGIISFFVIILGIFGAIFAAMGVCLVCTLPALAFILGLFGMSIGTLYDYNKVFISIGILSMTFSLYLYRRRKCNNGVCKIDLVKKPSKKPKKRKK